MTDGQMTRDQMLTALERLGEVLMDRGIEGHLYVVGRAAIVLAYAGNELTFDIDARADPADEMLAAARDLAAELDLPDGWLNDAAAAFIPGIATDAGVAVLEKPGITVRAAPAEVVLAMKLLAAREKDVADVRLLADILSLRTGDEVWAVFEKHYSCDAIGGTSLLFPGESERALAMVRDMFGPVARPHRPDGPGNDEPPPVVRRPRR